MLRSLVRRLPPTLLDALKWAYRLFGRLTAPPVSSVHVMLGGGEMATADRKDPFNFVDGAALQELGEGLGGYHKRKLLQVQLVRQVLARERVKHLMAQGYLRRLPAVAKEVAFNTLDYNLDGAVTAADLDRPSIMFNVVTAIERVRQNIENLDVLSIGPRSEIEIFAMMAVGFNPDRIHAVDLFTYSPYVELGDMHNLPYADNAFDIAFLGWVLSYSRDQSVVVREIMRVCRDRAIVVLAGDYSDNSRDRPTFKNESSHMQSCDQLLALFGDRVGNVYFRHDPEMPKVTMVMTVFEVRKS